MATKPEYRLLPLHSNEIYLEKCCEVLNNQWKRSVTARLHSLSKSREELPCSLVLVEFYGLEGTLLGHCKVCRVMNSPCSCWIESFIVRQNRRGQGFGKVLMEKIEAFAKGYGFSSIYLMTEDKEEFYKHLGFQRCDPVSAIGGCFDSVRLPVNKVINVKEDIILPIKNADILPSNQFYPVPPPPPPPPLSKQALNVRGNVCTWMMKNI